MVACGSQRPAGSDLRRLASAGLFARVRPPRRPLTVCAHIICGPYFAQKHALLVVETSFAFPETNDGGVFSFGGQSGNVFYVDNDNIIFYNLFAFLYFADFIAWYKSPGWGECSFTRGDTEQLSLGWTATGTDVPYRGWFVRRCAGRRMRTCVQVWARAQEAGEDFLWIHKLDLQAGAG